MTRARSREDELARACWLRGATRGRSWRVVGPADYLTVWRGAGEDLLDDPDGYGFRAPSLLHRAVAIDARGADLGARVHDVMELLEPGGNAFVRASVEDLIASPGRRRFEAWRSLTPMLALVVLDVEHAVGWWSRGRRPTGSPSLIWVG